MAKKSTKPDAAPLFPEMRVSNAPIPGARPLFLPNLLKEAGQIVGSLRGKELEKAHIVFLKWIQDLEAGVLHAQNETQVEQDFYRVLLGSLGYKTSFDVETGSKWNMQPKFHRDGAETADVTLGSFHKDEQGKLFGEEMVVGEIKGTKTKDLDRKGQKDRSPVQQAWGYLNSSDSAKWALVSNYMEFRLYSRQRSNRYVYRVVLTELKDIEAFSQFFAVFCAESLLERGGIALNALALLTQTGDRQEKVGEELYHFYAENRAGLIREIQTRRQVSLDVAIQTAQRLLDRILFIAFAQTRGLLSDRQLLHKTYEARVAGMTRWMAFQFLFRAIDIGDESNGVPRYNGNLFKEDEIIDDPNFNLDSERWPNVFRSFGDYDYQNEVTVDVLGRIFEKSITDIEEIKAAGLEEHEVELAKRLKQSIRKSKGVYYTADYIVEYLTRAALEPILKEARRKQIERFRFEAGVPDPPPPEYTRNLLVCLDKLKVCDPACGSGAFLTAAYNWFEENRLDLLSDLSRAEPDAPECQDERGLPGDIEDWRARSAPFILRNNVFGVDILKASVEIAQLSLWIRTARRDKPLTDLSANVVSANSLTADWSKLFSIDVTIDKFDAIVGNPPYVKEANIDDSKNILKTYQCYHPSADLYAYFYEKGMSLLAADSRLAFISSGTFVKAAFAAPLRRLLLRTASLESVIDFGEFQPFPEAEIVRPSCFVLRKSHDLESFRLLRFVCGETPPRDLEKAIGDHGRLIDHLDSESDDWQLEPAPVVSLLRNLQGSGVSLPNFSASSVYRGIISGLSKAFNIDSEQRNTITRHDSNSLEVIKPFLDGEDLRPWHREDNGKWLILFPNGFTTANSGIEDEALAWKWIKTTYPGVAEHLGPFETKAKRRQDKGRFWWELRSCDYYDAFEKPKIVWPDIAKLPRCSLDTDGCFFSNTAYFIPSNDYFVLGVMNSWAVWFVISKTAQPLRLRGGRWQYRCFQQFMELLPIPAASSNARQPIADLAEKMTGWSKEQYQLREKVKRRFESTFGALFPAKISEKLEAWPSLSFSELGYELKKVYKKNRNPWDDPGLVDVWDPYMSAQHLEYADFTRKLMDASAEINSRVYRLFGLNGQQIELLTKEVAPCP